MAASDKSLDDRVRDEADRWVGQVCVNPWPSGAQVKRVSLALQGGGAHGAFTWGVLDRLLEEDSLAIEGVSGTSAGALNAVVLAYGLSLGGRPEARRRLERLWRSAARAAAFSPLQPSLLDRALGLGRMDYSPGYQLLELAGRLLSPYQFNPLNLDPLRNLLGELVDFDFLRHCQAIKLFVSATNVRRGRLKVFTLDDLSLDAVMASACLPFLSQAVEIDGEHYWDGGYIGNPVIYPLLHGCRSQDVVLVQINPMNIEGVPTTAREILDRINTLTFNAGLVREMRSIDLITRLIDEGKVSDPGLKRLYLHVINDERAMATLGGSSKLNADWAFLLHLKEVGQQAAERWLAENASALGQRSTVSIPDMYL